MVIYGKSIEEILRNNIGKEKELVIGVGVQVVTKPFNANKPFFYKTRIQGYSGNQLNYSGATDEQKVNTVKVLARCEIEKFQEQIKNNQLVEVLEDDFIVKKLIRADSIQEVQAFIFDPWEKAFKKVQYFYG